MIGLNDMGAVLVEIILAILALETRIFHKFFVLPVDRAHIWLAVAQIFLVDFMRVVAYLYLVKQDKTERRPRLIMGLVRVFTLALHLSLLAYALYLFGPSGYSLVILANVLLFLIDVYFCAVIFSFYRLSPHD